MRISILICSLLLLAVTATQAQTKQKKVREKLPDTIPLFNGVTLGIDLAAPLFMAFGNSYKGSELSADVNLKHKYFPTLELGAGTYTHEEAPLRFEVTGSFARLGANINLFKATQADNFGYIGIRYGYSFSQYDYRGITTDNPYWENQQVTNALNQNVQTHWAELVAGVRVHIYKRLSLGWIFRYGYLLGQSDCLYGKPHYTPGFGLQNSSSVNVNFCLYYKL